MEHCASPIPILLPSPKQSYLSAIVRSGKMINQSLCFTSEMINRFHSHSWMRLERHLNVLAKVFAKCWLSDSWKANKLIKAGSINIFKRIPGSMRRECKDLLFSENLHLWVVEINQVTLSKVQEKQFAELFFNLISGLLLQRLSMDLLRWMDCLV